MLGLHILQRILMVNVGVYISMQLNEAGTCPKSDLHVQLQVLVVNGRIVH